VTGATRNPSAADLRVGGYRLLAKIGEGGMGVVHLAQSTDGRRVALKVLRPHIIGDDEARERLGREVASLRRVRSRRVAEVLDADPWGETPYVATRYVPGLSLHEHIRQEGPLRGEDLRYFAAGLAEAVIAVHTVGVLHRDIKPSNVLLEGRAPVLIDFGLARVAEDPRLTHTGWLLGTPGYLAPEILYGDDATTASDVHSWAATVVLAATGTPPFGTGPAMAIMDRVRRGQHDLSQVPRELLPTLERCLAPDPEDRPEMAAVLASLRGPAEAAPAGARGGDLTMPLAAFAPLAAPVGRDGTKRPPFAPAGAPTEQLGTDTRTEQLGTGTRTEQLGAEARTRQLGQDAHTQQLDRDAHTQQLDRLAPAPTRLQPPMSGEANAGALGAADENDAPPGQWSRARGDRSGLGRVQRGGLSLGLWGGVTAGFATAPYVTLVVLGFLALAVRTLSWTQEATQDRRWRRGRSRWYDRPLAVVSTPWYLLVASGGTVLLLAWALLLAGAAGFVALLLRPPVVAAMLATGGVLGLALWWGPGARRLRRPTRVLWAGLTRWAWLGWVAVAAIALVDVLLLVLLESHGVDWSPEPGPPWRPGTLLGRLARYL
jgi:predicted Ser/Thr protein kinase